MTSAANRLCAAAVLLAALTASFATPAAAPVDDPSVQRGAYIATASDCAACHTVPGGKPFAGGLPIASPVGTIYSTNITPSAAAGIGGYTEAEFARAVRQGVRKSGENLYPAMPYTSYRLLTDADVHDLYAYFQHGVAPVDVVPTRTVLPFPLNIRASMMGWNLLFRAEGPFTADASRSAPWNRGAYLVEGPAHCGECHTPRGLLMQVRSRQALAGGQVGPWFAPNITPDPASGIGSWSKADLVQYLHSGSLPGKARAAGGMGEAVEHSFQHLASADLDAMASYLVTVPAVHDGADTVSRFDVGAPGNALAAVRGAGGVVSDTGSAPGGAKLFAGNCASCHAASGQGSKDAYYPSLFHNSVTGAAEAGNLIATILYGVHRTTAAGEAYMPGFGGSRNDIDPLSDAQIAAISTYVLRQYGRAQPVSDSDVAVVRQGGPASPLLLLARLGLAIAVVAMGLVVWALFALRRRHRNSATA
jgi:mono/diheme cytochrome c family protein